MRLRPDTLGMTAVLALMTALGPLSTDLYLPSLPAIAKALGTSVSDAQLTLSIYLIGFAVGQVFYGPISDRIGRRPVALAGLGLYAVASLFCALAASIDQLILARFVQALGAAGPIVLGRAIVRDLYEGARAGRELSRMGTIMGLVPAIAPVLGGVLEVAFGWRSAFYAALLAAVALAAVIALALPETLKQRSPDALSIPGILRGFGVLLRHPGYRVYVGLASLTYGGLFCFISASSFVLQGRYGLDPFLFGLSFAFGVLGYITGTLVAQKVLARRGLDGTIALGVLCLAGGGAIMLALVLIGTGSSLEITVPMALYAAGVGLVLPPSNASAMMPFPDRAGAASSLQGLIQMTFAALVGIGIGHAIEWDGRALPVAIFLMGLAAVALFHGTARVRTGR
jgi:DHA1 family bicyclomycin/chloramphenicol resistance-like MFS transporter